MQLPEAQVAVLRAADAQENRPITDIAGETAFKPETMTGAAFALEEEGLVTVTEAVTETLEQTDEGRAYIENGLPEVRLYEAARAVGAETGGDGAAMGAVIDAAGLDGEAVDIALANFARKGYGEIDSGEVHPDPDADPEDDPEAAALAALAAGEEPAESPVERLVDRGLVTRHEGTRRLVGLTQAGVTELMAGVEATEQVDRLTPELLTSGEWRDVEFAEYNVAAEADDVQAGRKHPLRRMADRVKNVFVGMGFEEMQGPTADADFWIHDCLFMPQDHPARTHWDRFELDVPPMDELPEGLVDRVEDAHRNGVGPDGDGYHSPWDEEFARAVALRGHTTSLSMRYLSGHAVGELEPPQRYFSVRKVYRNDTLDPTHLLEFFQIEGWVMAEELSVRDLMGTFTEFYEQFGITDLEFKPHYNPYTEPSFELFGKHPETGELIEIGNSGIFREEVLSPLGVECDVMAWGLALERLLMLMYGFEDIRDVHGTLCDLDLLRNVEVVY